MTSLVTYPDHASQRARVVADAVVSAYINEITRPAPAPRPDPTVARARPARARRPGHVQARAPRRRAAIVL